MYSQVAYRSLVALRVRAERVLFRCLSEASSQTSVCFISAQRQGALTLLASGRRGSSSKQPAQRKSPPQMSLLTKARFCLISQTL